MRIKIDKLAKEVRGDVLELDHLKLSAGQVKAVVLATMERLGRDYAPSDVLASLEGLSTRYETSAF